jgi:hypothetical protein
MIHTPAAAAAAVLLLLATGVVGAGFADAWADEACLPLFTAGSAAPASSAAPRMAVIISMYLALDISGCFTLLAAGCLVTPRPLAGASADAALLPADAVARQLLLLSGSPGFPASKWLAACRV